MANAAATANAGTKTGAFIRAVVFPVIEVPLFSADVFPVIEVPLFSAVVFPGIEVSLCSAALLPVIAFPFS